MKSYRSRFDLPLLAFALIALVGALGLENPARAEATVEFNGYARSSFQIGTNGRKGENLNSGFAKQNRLQEGQYFELGAQTKLPHDSRFAVTFAHSGDTFHYSGDWDNPPGIVVRNLYFEVGKLPEAQNVSAWFGSRMYRGSDIYLFDTWPLDEQNILGGGVTVKGAALDMEFAVGARGDTAYEIDGNARKDKIASLTSSGQRYIFINKLIFPLAGDRQLKTNFEYHYVPKSTATYKQLAPLTAASGTLETPADAGLGLGLQVDILGTNRAFVRYGSGHITGAIQTLATPLPTVTLLDGTQVANPKLYTRDGNRAFAFGLSNALELKEQNAGVIYALISEFHKPKGLDTGSSVSAAIRPMFYATEQVHAGFELDLVHYFKPLSAGDISVGTFSPMIEYALNKNVFGSPKLRLIASNAFYAREVAHYGEVSKRAFNIGMGFEVWF